jgi:hypothetical protein
MHIEFYRKRWYIDNTLFGQNCYDGEETILYYDAHSPLITRYGAEFILNEIWDYYERDECDYMHFNYSVGLPSVEFVAIIVE